MKKFTLLLLSILLFGTSNLQAQNWVNGGNNLTGTGRIGTNTEHALVFKTFNKERGRISADGLWGIGTATPSAKFHLNSVTGHNPLMVQVNNVTKLLAHTNGGVAVGANVTPPANGLYVSSLVGIGTTAPNSKVHINTVANQDPLRVMYNGATKMLVHRNGGVSVGANVTPPANGLFTNRLLVHNYLTVANNGMSATDTSEFGIGVRADGWGINGTGILSEGGFMGIFGRGNYYGIEGRSEFGTGIVGSSTNSYGGEFYSVNGTALSASTTNGSYAARFNGSIYTSGTYQGSDKNIKQNIQEVDNAMSIINKLKPYNYEFREDGKYASLNMPNGKHYGLLAQDVEEVLPELVKESAHELTDHKSLATIKTSADGKSVLASINKELKETINIKAVNYTELIPIVIKGLQEQQQTIQEQAKTIQQQQQEIDELKERFARLEATLGPGKNGSTGGLNGVSMHQNYPNPVNGTTTINYSIPTGTSGKILVYDSTGKLVRTLAASDTGQVQMNAYGLSAGTYTYSLIVEGQIIDSKHMLVEW